MSGIDIRVVTWVSRPAYPQYHSPRKYHAQLPRDEVSIEDVNRLTEDMYRIVIPPGSEIIHVMPQDYTVDYEEGIKDPVGMSVSNWRPTSISLRPKTSAINNINKCVRRASLEIQDLILEPLASSLAVLVKKKGSGRLPDRYWWRDH